ncbi:unnamed protein product [Caenorhabditis sp. 36 PRJEB53466]|nr:unnamed protein product [Caenorhabditis sp. 36 PRJEB53466]
MEALPNMPMMAPQFRTSTLSYDNIPNFNFRLTMKEHILLTFQTDPHEFDEAFDELAQLKFEANIPSASVEQICKLKRYYGQLCMMQKRFPMGVGEQLETPFAWHDGLVDMRSAHSEVTINDIEFEKASVMFNIGACHAQYAAEQPRDTQDSIKAAFSHFQCAAFAFEQLNSFRNSDMFYPSVDLDANVIAFYYKVLIAQAQECLVQKSLLDNRTPIVIAKLSMWLQETFESAARIVDEWSINIPESVQKYYSKLCRLKSDMYGVITYMSLGDHSEKEEKKMGWRLQYYNIAAKFMESVTMDRKMKERYPEMLVTASFLFDVINAKQKNAEKENDFIYHERVPKPEEAIDAAKKDGGGGAMCKVRTVGFDPLDPSVCGNDLFASLLPSVVVDANNRYAEKKADIVRANTEKVEAYDRHLNDELARADFDKLRFMLNEGQNAQVMFEIPEELLRRNADMTSFPDCIPNLLERLRESSDTARVAEAKLNTLIAKLRGIDLPRLKADEGFILISRELDKLAEHLQNAKSANASLNKAIAAHSANLQLLSLPCDEMWAKIIPALEKPQKNRGDKSREEVQVRKMVDKIVEMKTQRAQLISQLRASLEHDDISKKLMGTNEQGAEQIMKEEITKHAQYQQAIQLNVQAQEVILRTFVDANADFCEERMAMGAEREEYERRVGELVASYDVYKDVLEKTEQGEQFYRQLMARCDQFAVPVHAMEEQYRAEVEKKERAQKEAEQHMQQLRMSREAQNAMMDFGGAQNGQLGPRTPQMAPPGQFGGSAGRPPRLGDFLESYRARKQGNHPQQIPQEEVPAGPPSPTPSSICEFPVSSGRSQRMMASPRYGGAAQGYQAPFQGIPQGPRGPGAHGPLPGVHTTQFGANTAPSRAPTSQFGASGAYGVPGALPTVPGPHYGGSGPISGVPGVQFGATGALGAQGTLSGGPAAHGAPGAQYGAHGAAGPQFGASGAHVEPLGAPTNHFGAPGTPVPPGSQLGAAGAQFGAHQTTGAPGAAGSALGAQGPPFGAAGVHQLSHSNSSSSAVHLPPSPIPSSVVAQTPQQNYRGAPEQPAGQYYGAFPPAQQHYQGYAPGYGSTQAPPTSATPGYPQYQQQQQFQPPQQQQYQAPAPPPAYQAPNAPIVPVAPQPPHPQYQTPPPTQPSYQAAHPAHATQVFQHPPQGAPISAPAPQQHQHVPPYQGITPTQQQQFGASNTSQNNFAPSQQFGAQFQPFAPISAPQPASAPSPAPQAAAPSTPAPPQRFQPTPAAPSPWHATPAELKSPWNTTPQYHAPQSQPEPAAPAPPASVAPGAPAAAPSVPSTRSNIDLLSDLLGDFNLPPPIQPTVQNSQNLQAPPTRSDFRAVPSQLDPGKPVHRPAAAVPPMPQQLQTREVSIETPILIKGAAGASLSVTEIVDPGKFQMGEGDAQKLEKRMLHHSIRTNGPAPPLNQADPLNRIDAFTFARSPKK